MNAILEEAYFTWLYKQVGVLSAKNPSRTHWSLAKQLYAKEFVWFIPNDDNRLEDGRDLRFEFLVEQELDDPGPEWMGLGCSMFEMLIRPCAKALLSMLMASLVSGSGSCLTTST